MCNFQKIPVVTIILALLITIIQILRSLGGRYDEFILTHLDWVNWEVFYAQPWRILTSPFLHHNLSHFFNNLVFLCLFGWQVERQYGSVKTLGIFFGALVTSHVMCITFTHDWIWGISLGVCGLLGFSLIANGRAPWWTTLTHRPLHALYLASLISPFIPFFANTQGFRTSHMSHLGGILYGLAFGVTFRLLPRHPQWRWAVIALPFLLFASQFYSPWQIEWRLVNRISSRVTANAECQIRSIEPKVYTPVDITVVNASTRRIALFWIDYEGNPRAYFWLRPGSSDEYSLFIDHRWCIVDADTGKLLEVVVLKEPQTITIR
jgi:membrane associated rhomboid family serine protease